MLVDCVCRRLRLGTGSKDKRSQRLWVWVQDSARLSLTMKKNKNTVCPWRSWILKMHARIPSSQYGPSQHLSVLHDIRAWHNSWSIHRAFCEAAKMGSAGFWIFSLQVQGYAALVRRGNCDFTTKARVAQKAGAVVVLVVNDKQGYL